MSSIYKCPRSTRPSTAFLTTVFGAAAAWLGLNSALAQESQQAQAEDNQSAETTVVVTGSRLIRTDLTAPSPVTVLSSEDLNTTGNVTIENTLQALPQLAAGMNSQANANGPNGSAPGVLSANLRGLGNTRTLVLVNGRRFISANSDGIVDLASIPDMLVDRVEVITGGASAVYGSDAIAGAVNFILKKKFDGLQASYLFGQTGESDGTTHKVDLAVGSDFSEGRGNVLVYGSYTQRDSVSFADRDFAKTALGESPDGFVPLGSSNIPGTRINLSSSQLATLQGVDLPANGSASCGTLAGVRFGEGGEVLPFCRNQDLYNFGPFNYLQRPLQREQVSGLTSYTITPGVQAYSELHYINSRNAFQQAPQSGGLETPGSPNGGVLVPNYATNGNLFAPVRQFLIDNAAVFDPDGDGTAEIVDTGRRGTETGPRHYDYERDAFNLTGGLRGEFGMGDKQWNWDSFYQYQRSRTDERTDGIYSLTRVGLGLDVVVDPDGTVRCRVEVLGCVPVNPFGIGAITPEAGKFISTTRTSLEVFERRMAGASITGAPFAVPAGDVSVAVGLEHRRDQVDFTPGGTDLAQEYGADSRGAVNGSYTVTEYFGEVRVPILAHLPGIDILAVEGAARQAKYSSFGNSTTWKAGLEYGPVSWLRFRSAFNRALRAPTLNELFSPISRGFSGGQDPCAFTATHQPSAAEQGLCVQQGVPQADLDQGTFTQGNVGVNVFSGGNPSLQPETSETFTVGAVVQVPFVDGLNLTVDYFNVKVDDAVQTIDAQSTLDACFKLLDNNSTPCQAIGRFAGNGQINFVNTNLSNIASLKVNGLDTQLDYTFHLPDALSFRSNAAKLMLVVNANWLFEETSKNPNSAATDCAGFIGGSCTGQTAFGVPDFRGNISARWMSGPLTVRAQARLVGSMSLSPGVESIVKSVPMQTYADLSGTFRFANDKVEVFAGVNNLFDKQPPILGFDLAGDANTDTSLYDVIGRRYFLGVRTNF